MARTEPTDTSGPVRTATSDPPWVQLAIEPHPDANCALADRLAISDSAASQRLKVAGRKLARAFLDDE